MLSLTEKERETMLVLFKDFAAYYNANSISKVLKISHVGAQKILKRLLHENLVKYQQIGKSIENFEKFVFQANFSKFSILTDLIHKSERKRK